MLNGLGKALLAGALLLAAGGGTGLAAIQGDGGQAVGEHGTELLSTDLKEASEALKLPLAQTDQFDSSRFDLFPNIDTEL